MSAADSSAASLAARSIDNRIVYREVVEPERLVYSHGADRDDDQ